MKKPDMSDASRQKFTAAVHAGAQIDSQTGAVMVPIYQTSTYVQQAPGEHLGWDYSRAGNPTRDALEAAFAQLEDAKFGLAFASGLAAEQAIIQILRPGDEVLVCDDVYGGTGRLFRRLYEKYAIKFHFIDMNSEQELTSHLSAKTAMIWLESPTNPLLKIFDIPKIATHAKSRNALLVVDNTFCSPIFQNPLDLGADIVVHSTTKYIGGHSDIIGGALMTNRQDLFDQLKFIQFAAGAVPGPFESFLLHRSIKTLAVRMMAHQNNAIHVAKFLESHPEIEQVYYPGLASHPQHQIAIKQMSGFSGMVSFRLKGAYSDVKNFLSKLKIFKLAESLGGVESLVNHPEKMTHASVPEDLRRKLGIDSNLLRLSVGIEHQEDLVNDLSQALSKTPI